MSLAFLQKKSFNPTNINNVERVWKAEQAAAAEKKKLMELQKQLAEERQVMDLKQLQKDAGNIKHSLDRLDWMYEVPVSEETSAEDYLLGKKTIGEDSSETKAVNEQISVQSRVAGANFSASITTSANDMFRRINEDPMLAIRERAKAERLKVMQNPVLMKQLREALKVKKQSKKAKKSKKSSKKHKKKSKKHRKKGDSVDSSDEEDDGKAAVNVNNGDKGKKETIDVSGTKEAATDVGSRSRSRSREQGKRVGERSSSGGRRERRSRSRSRSRERRRRSSPIRRRRDEKRSRSRDRDRSRDRYRHRDSKGRSGDGKRRDRSRSRDQDRRISKGRSGHSRNHGGRGGARKMMGAAEREAALARMKSDAATNDVLRGKRIEEAKKADAEDVNRDGKNNVAPVFLSDMNMKSIDVVSDRK